MELSKTLYFHCLIQFSEQLYEVNNCDVVCVCVCVCVCVRECVPALVLSCVWLFAVP